MKRKISTIPILLSMIISMGCKNHSKEHFIVKEFMRHTGLRNYFKIVNYNITDSQFVLNVDVNDSAGKQLEKQFFFISYKNFLESISNPKREPGTDVKLNGFNVADDNYTYYLGRIAPSSEYFVICLSKKKDKLIFVESTR